MHELFADKPLVKDSIVSYLIKKIEHEVLNNEISQMYVNAAYDEVLYQIWLDLAIIHDEECISEYKLYEYHDFKQKLNEPWFNKASCMKMVNQQVKQIEKQYQ